MNEEFLKLIAIYMQYRNKFKGASGKGERKQMLLLIIRGTSQKRQLQGFICEKSELEEYSDQVFRIAKMIRRSE